MIRQMVRHPLATRVVTLAAMMAVATIDVPIIAAQLEAPKNKPVAQAALRQLPSPLAPDQIEQVRQRFLVLRESSSPRAVNIAKRALQRLEIATAKTPSERHKLIRQLPVSIVRSAATDGRAGIMKNFVARGKTRLSWFTPVGAAANGTSEPVEQEQPSGPAASTGRWKSGGSGECYWDPYDSGPDQCQPNTTGRWKSGGGSVCYWDGNDEGPDQCTPSLASGMCWDGEPPCISEGEMEDLAITVADTLAELEALEDDLNAEIANYEWFCSQNPSSCAEHVLQPSGPSSVSDIANCWSKAGVATVAVAGAIAGTILTHGAVNAPPVGYTLSAVGAAAAYTSVFAAGFFAGYYVGSAIDCFINTAPLPSDVGLFLAGREIGAGCPTGAPLL